MKDPNVLGDVPSLGTPRGWRDLLGILADYSSNFACSQ